MPVIPALCEVEIRRAVANILSAPISKIRKVKWTEDVAQGFKSLLCKHEALSSNSSTTKKKRKKNSKEQGTGGSRLYSYLLWRQK
jgi:hypothetical protein